MEYYIIDEDILKDIADAIREKLGETGSYKLSEMATKINSMNTIIS